jgi:hypothetical protein
MRTMFAMKYKGIHNWYRTALNLVPCFVVIINTGFKQSGYFKVSTARQTKPSNANRYQISMTRKISQFVVVLAQWNPKEQ